MCHKLVLREISNDSVRWARQMNILNKHKIDQRRDRQVYWAIRAEARIYPFVISLIIDGMDQGQFAYPRHPFTKSKDLDGMQRPRLHVNGCLVHGHLVLVTVSRADFRKDTNVTCELIAHVLTRLKQARAPLHRAKLHVQLDNTSSNNTNNILLGCLA